MASRRSRSPTTSRSDAEGNATSSPSNDSAGCCAAIAAWPDGPSRPATLAADRRSWPPVCSLGAKARSVFRQRRPRNAQFSPKLPRPTLRTLRGWEQGLTFRIGRDTRISFCVGSSSNIHHNRNRSAGNSSRITNLVVLHERQQAISLVTHQSDYFKATILHRLHFSAAP